MGILIIRLLTIINAEDFDSTTYHIANVLLKNYEKIKHSSIDDISKLANVSKSTLSKFARTIGFDSYVHLKDNAEFIENRYGNNYNYLTNIIGYLETRDFVGYFDTIIQDIRNLEDAIDILAIDRLVEDLINYNEIGVFGLLFSESAAIDLQYKLAYNQKYVVTYQDDLKQEQYIRNADENTLIIIITNSGNYLREQQVYPGRPPKRYFEQSKAKIFAITSDKNILDLPYVSDALVFPENSNIHTHNILYQIIFDIIISRYRARTKRLLKPEAEL